MGWEKRLFKKRKTVWAKTTDESEDYELGPRGLVPIKYDNSENAKLYAAHSSNLSEWKDDGKGSDKPKKKKTKSKIEHDENVWKTPGLLVKTLHAHEDYDADRPEEGSYDIFTDGACKKNPGPCGAGVVVVGEEEVYCISQFIGTGTNNIAELFAIKIALDTSPKEAKIRVHSDSSYAIGVVSKGWKAKVNKDLVEAIRTLMDDFDSKPSFIKVKGHSGIPLNERADELAVEATIRKK